jgi:hypothetical protein
MADEQTRALLRALQESMNETFDRLCTLAEGDLDAPTTHPCGHGRDGVESFWHIVANDIDHEKIHAGSILNTRHDLRLMQTPPQRMLAEWLVERAALIGTLIGLRDEDLDLRLNADEWSVREHIAHTIFWQRDSVTQALRDLAGGPPWSADPALDYTLPAPDAAAASGDAAEAAG